MRFTSRHEVRKDEPIPTPSRCDILFAVALVYSRCADVQPLRTPGALYRRFRALIHPGATNEYEYELQQSIIRVPIKCRILRYAWSLKNMESRYHDIRVEHHFQVEPGPVWYMLHTT